MASDSASANGPPLGKYLASTDKKTRDKAIKNLAAFLSDPSRDALPKSEMAKLWKGVFYCFWMSDKPLVQQALASEIADILLAISSLSVSLAFLRGFWESTVKEWNSIDRLRIDKYYMLVRRFVNASFRLLIREGWEAAAVKEYNSILTDRGGPLRPDDTKVPTSLAYHLADIYLEELDKALGKSPVESPLPAPLSTLLAPFLALSARTPTSITLQRIQSALLEPLLTAFASRQDSDEPSRKRPRLSTPEFPNLAANACTTNPPKEGSLDPFALRKAVLKQVFDVASEPDTRDANRRKLYAFWKEHIEDEDDSSGSGARSGKRDLDGS
ncbi:Nop52-domain-containing protein [Dichomitus squalens]|uniref:Nop52-domain-containing protein n=1 Tax=Dichomitus squalens (strain LYAD-421) TaxID=732165 RepID=UPI0004415BFC|nr:Nop52-domain-containing protein [Dichomitus squalens LYAD-421 SS1]EJF67193.1 Nop52-domain-containing protein [Dichomitus squalens LYAD-421 SS1]TBU49327.1 Nop52-domain-containing protein [Dichomitus squalens]